jgi:hypothetical protein
MYRLLRETVRQYRRQKSLFPYNLSSTSFDAYLIDIIKENADYFKSLNKNALDVNLTIQLRPAFGRKESFDNAAGDALLIATLQKNGRRVNDVIDARVMAMKTLSIKPTKRFGQIDDIVFFVRKHFEENCPNRDHSYQLSYFDAVFYFSKVLEKLPTH